MRTISGLIAGTIALTLLQIVTSNPDAAGRVSLLLTGPAALLRRWTAADIPLIPDRRT